MKKPRSRLFYNLTALAEDEKRRSFHRRGLDISSRLAFGVTTALAVASAAYGYVNTGYVAVAFLTGTCGAAVGAVGTALTYESFAEMYERKLTKEWEDKGKPLHDDKPQEIIRHVLDTDKSYSRDYDKSDSHSFHSSHALSDSDSLEVDLSDIRRKSAKSKFKSL